MLKLPTHSGFHDLFLDYIIDISLKVAFSIHNPACVLNEIVHMQSVPITTNFASSNPAQTRCTR